MIRDIINIYIYIIIEVTDNVLTNILPNIPKYLPVLLTVDDFLKYYYFKKSIITFHIFQQYIEIFLQLTILYWKEKILITVKFIDKENW